MQGWSTSEWVGKKKKRKKEDSRVVWDGYEITFREMMKIKRREWYCRNRRLGIM